MRELGDYVEGSFVIKYRGGVYPTWRAVSLEQVKVPHRSRDTSNLPQATTEKANITAYTK